MCILVRHADKMKEILATEYGTSSLLVHSTGTGKSLGSTSPREDFGYARSRDVCGAEPLIVYFSLGVAKPTRIGEYSAVLPRLSPRRARLVSLAGASRARPRHVLLLRGSKVPPLACSRVRLSADA